MTSHYVKAIDISFHLSISQKHSCHDNILYYCSLSFFQCYQINIVNFVLEHKNVSENTQMALYQRGLQHSPFQYVTLIQRRYIFSRYNIFVYLLNVSQLHIKLKCRRKLRRDLTVAKQSITLRSLGIKQDDELLSENCTSIEKVLF